MYQGRLRRAENRVANAERRARETEERQEPGEADTSSQGPLIPRPPRVSRIHVGDLREMLGVSKPEWDNLRVCSFLISASSLNYKANIST